MARLDSDPNAIFLVNLEIPRGCTLRKIAEMAKVADIADPEDDKSIE